MQILAIIPARGGSKGIPRKNLKLLAGKPLLAHSILHAKQTPSVNRIVVSTDDAEIAAVSREWGAEVVPRPPEISGDTATSESALLHALDYLEQKDGYEPDLVVFLQATSPMRQGGEVQAAIETLRRENADSLLSVSPLNGFLWRVEKDGSVRSFSYDYRNRPRRQDAPEDLIDNGSIYIFKPWVLRQYDNRLGGKIALHRMGTLDSFQIDTPADFELLEHLMAFRSAEGGSLKPETEPQSPEIRPSAFKNVRLLVLDFDGVMTDNRVLVAEDGKEAVFCSRGDGLGLQKLREKGIEIVVISKEKNPVVSARCRKLGIECIQGCDNKLTALRQRADRQALSADNVGYVGNDVNDLACLKWAGFPIAVADAVPEVKAVVKMITTKRGGRGAVREICDMLLRVV